MSSKVWPEPVAVDPEGRALPAPVEAVLSRTPVDNPVLLLVAGAEAHASGWAGRMAVRLATDWEPARFADWPALLVAGLLVGFGTRMGSGCTSGHGVCGVSRLSQRSIVATGAFMAAGIATVFVLSRIGG